MEVIKSFGCLSSIPPTPTPYEVIKIQALPPSYTTLHQAATKALCWPPVDYNSYTGREILDILDKIRFVWTVEVYKSLGCLSSLQLLHCKRKSKSRHHLHLTPLYAKDYDRAPVRQAIWKLTVKIFGITYVKCGLGFLESGWFSPCVRQQQLKKLTHKL